MPYFLLGDHMNKERIKKKIKDIYPYVIVVIVVILIRTFIVTPAIVDGVSMKPNLQDKDIILLNKLDYKLDKIQRFDVVVVNWNGEKLVKRVVGLPGEHIEFKDNTLYVDGLVEIERYKHDATSDFNLHSIGYLTLPGDKYFVIGDNRDDSIDSRVIGPIDKKNILGKVTYRIFPVNKIKRVK